MQPRRLISIVIPAYNEERRIGPSIRFLRTYLDKLATQAPQYTFEVVVSIEKSRDQTVAVTQKATQTDPRFRILAHTIQRGKGRAVREGVLSAQGEICFFMDADLSTSLDHVQDFLAFFEQHPEVQILIGDRKNPDTEILKKQNWFRRKMGEIFNFFVQYFVMKGIRDTQCGFKAFRRDAAETLFTNLKREGFSFDVELLVLAQKMNYTVKTLPVVWTNSPDSKVRIIRDSVKMLMDILVLKREVASRELVVPLNSNTKTIKKAA